VELQQYELGKQCLCVGNKWSWIWVNHYGPEIKHWSRIQKIIISRTKKSQSLVQKVSYIIYSYVEPDRTVSFVRRPTNAQGNSGFFIIDTFQILPRRVSAYGYHPQGVVNAL
jgi:hypothetical protein